MPYERVARELTGTAFASIAYVEETGSTNADAAALLGDDRFGGHTIVAEFQREGAGRKGRAWEAPAGTSLLFTTIFPRAIETRHLWLVPFWVALAVRSGLHRCGVSTLLQWPNDLLLGERKLGGILCQSRVSGSEARVACGVGINVHRPVPVFDADARAFCEDAAEVERAALLSAILRAYDATQAALDDPQRVTREWERAAEIPGRRYRVLRDGASAPFDSTAQALERGGALRVERDDGTSEIVEMADARVLR